MKRNNRKAIFLQDQVVRVLFFEEWKTGRGIWAGAALRGKYSVGALTGSTLLGGDVFRRLSIGQIERKYRRF
jgi:hypothetical protein